MQNTFKIFLVEDDIWYAELLQYHLSLDPEFEVRHFGNAKDLLGALNENPQVICTDFNLPDIDGGELVKQLKEQMPKVPLLVISGQNDVSTAIDLLKNDNVYDYLVKDDDTKDRLWKAVHQIKERSSLEEEVETLKEQLGQKYDFNEAIKGNSQSLQDVFKRMKKACDNNITVSITGETGTGKELVAQCIHFNSTRSKKPFVAVNMAAIPKELIESELFGHEKGAFTGAHARRIGKFEEAHKGTLFLDEIADLDASLQAKLLRVLQEREVTRIGGNKPIKIDVRVIVATYKDLAVQVKNNLFRQDLYFRLLGLPISLPPLRERKEDILLLAKHFVDQFCRENKKPKKTLSAEVRKKLNQYHYPGNVRELKAIMELSTVLADDTEIKPEDVTFNSSVSFTDFIGEDTTLKGFTSQIIRYYLDKHSNDVALVAKKLDIGKSTLYKMIQRNDV
ncbi:sigma-54-dependent Fis family transcriptional regulator [bacterium SCSIO 12741]|nr:sigma-54-dependent Fis family transcriptional regulator [bacterium SCSIO 12741]